MHRSALGCLSTCVTMLQIEGEIIGIRIYAKYSTEDAWLRERSYKYVRCMLLDCSLMREGV